VQGSSLRLIAGRTISQLGDGIYEIALLWVVTHLLKAPWSVAAVVAVGNLVSTAVVPLGGHVADRRMGQRKAIAVLADLGLMLLFALAAILWPALHGSAAYLALLAVTALTSVFVSFLFPSIGALFAALLTDGGRQSANSLYQTATSAANLGGLLLGGVLVALLPFQAILWLDAASFGLGWLLTLSVAAPAPAGAGEGVDSGRGGWRSVLRSPEVRALVGANVALNGALIIVMSLLPYFVVHSLRQGAAVLGVTQAALSAGVIVGSAGSRFVRGTPSRQFGFGFGALALAVLAVAALPAIVVTDAGLFVAAIAASVLSVTLMTRSQEVVAPEQYGKFLAASSVVTTVAQPSLAALGGAVATFVGVRWVFAGGAALTAALGGAAARGLGSRASSGPAAAPPG